MEEAKIALKSVKQYNQKRFLNNKLTFVHLVMNWFVIFYTHRPLYLKYIAV